MQECGFCTRVCCYEIYSNALNIAPTYHKTGLTAIHLRRTFPYNGVNSGPVDIEFKKKIRILINYVSLLIIFIFMHNDYYTTSTTGLQVNLQGYSHRLHGCTPGKNVYIVTNSFLCYVLIFFCVCFVIVYRRLHRLRERYMFKLQ